MGKRRYTDITVRGVTYATARDAAAGLGVTVRTVQRACQLGLTETLGLGRAHKPLMPICVRGVTYPDARAAAEALGISVGAIYQALHRGTIERVGLPANATPGNAVPIRVGPHHFACLRDLDRAIGRSPGYASNLLRKDPQGGPERLIGQVMAQGP